MIMEDNVKFGSDTKRRDFLLRDDSTFVNHGSFGAVPKYMFHKQTQFREELEVHPDEWFRINSPKYENESRILVAQYLGANEKNVVFVENTTAGINTVLKSFRYTGGDALLINDVTYPAIHNVADRTAEMFEGEVLVCTIPLPIAHEDDVVRRYEDFLKEHPGIKIAIIDHISSGTATLFPVKRLTEVCHRHNCLVLIDGAHAPGHIKDLNIEDFGADFYIGNLHKWCFVPRGCAVLWVHPDHQSWVKPLFTTWQHNAGFQKEFLRKPTRDSTPFITARYFIDFIKTIGGKDKLYEYNTDLITKAVDYLLEEWKEYKAEKFTIPPSMEAPFMRLIKIPHLKGYTFSSEGTEKATVDINKDYGVQAQFIHFRENNYIRLSVQIYNEMEDYKKLGEVMKRLFV